MWSEWNFFLIIRCIITIPISWYQIYAKRTKVLEVIPVLVNSGRVLIPYWKSVVQVGVKLISYQKMYNHNTDQLIPKLCQTNKDFRSYSHFSQFWACFWSPAEKVAGIKIYFSAKDSQSQYLSVDTKFMSNEQRFQKLLKSYWNVYWLINFIAWFDSPYGTDFNGTKLALIRKAILIL